MLYTRFAWEYHPDIQRAREMVDKTTGGLSSIDADTLRTATEQAATAEELQELQKLQEYTLADLKRRPGLLKRIEAKVADTNIQARQGHNRLVKFHRGYYIDKKLKRFDVEDHGSVEVSYGMVRELMEAVLRKGDGLDGCEAIDGVLRWYADGTKHAREAAKAGAGAGGDAPAASAASAAPSKRQRTEAITVGK